MDTLLLLQLIQYQEQSNLAFLLLVKSQGEGETLDLGELIKYCLMPVPPSLATPDGFVAKTNKAAILHYLLEDATPEDLSYPKDALFIQDGIALLHVLTNLPPTCSEICLHILDILLLSCPSHNFSPLAGAFPCPFCHCGQVVSRAGLV